LLMTGKSLPENTTWKCSDDQVIVCELERCVPVAYSWVSSDIADMHHLMVLKKIKSTTSSSHTVLRLPLFRQDFTVTIARR